MDLRILPKIRQIPKIKPKSFVLFPFELHAKMREPFEAKEAESLELIINHLKEFKKPYVASSHGKDSIVLVHLIWRACKKLEIPMIEVWLNHTLNTYKEEKDYWDEFNLWLGIEDKFKVFYPPKFEGKQETVWTIAKRYGLPNFRSTARGIKNSYRNTNIPQCCDILKKKTIKDFLKGLPEDKRYDCNFVGTRAQESQIRSLIVLQRCRSFFKKTRGAYPIRTVTPLSFWKATDILEYFARWEIPVNPTYEIHNLERMGCASCPAHIGWEERLARDPTEEGFGMLKQNLKILQATDQERFNESLNKLDFFCKSAFYLTEHQQDRLIELLRGFDNRVTITDFMP